MQPMGGPCSAGPGLHLADGKAPDWLEKKRGFLWKKYEKMMKHVLGTIQPMEELTKKKVAKFVLLRKWSQDISVCWLEQTMGYS